MRGSARVCLLRVAIVDRCFLVHEKNEQYLNKMFCKNNEYLNIIVLYACIDYVV